MAEDAKFNSKQIKEFKLAYGQISGFWPFIIWYNRHSKKSCFTPRHIWRGWRWQAWFRRMLSGTKSLWHTFDAKYGCGKRFNVLFCSFLCRFKSITTDLDIYSDGEVSAGWTPHRAWGMMIVTGELGWVPILAWRTLQAFTHCGDVNRSLQRGGFSAAFG